MKIQHKLIGNMTKKAALFGLAAYMTVYALSNGNILRDYLGNNRNRIALGKTDQRLKIGNYKIMLDGKEKYLALVGERHDYNKKEHEIGETLIEQYKNIAGEPGFIWKNNSLKNKLFLAKVMIPAKIANFYQHLGNGRWYPSISKTAVKQGRKVYELEPSNEPIDFLSKEEKRDFFKMQVKGAFSLKGPTLEYKIAKGMDMTYASLPRQDSNPSDDCGFESSKRDSVMAENIIALLKKEGVDSLLATAGNMHIPKILKYISENKEVQIIGLEPKNSYKKK